MKVIFNKSDLVSALDRVQRAAQTKVTSNTNNGFFISAAGGNILIQANDYTIGIKTSCPANIEEEGVTVIAAPQLQSTIRMMPAETLLWKKETMKIWFPSRADPMYPNFLPGIR